jgi:fatty-acyl-CoA synthase
LGAIWLGLNPRYQLNELRHVLGDARPSLVVAMLEIEGRSYRDEFSALRSESLAGVPLVASQGTAPGFMAWDEFMTRGAEVDEATLAAATAAVSAEDVALIVYTSGSTGAPKGALISHRAIIHSGRIQCEHWWGAPLRILNFAPINHIGGAIQLACHAIVCGGTNVMMSRFDPVAIPKVVRQEHITVLHLVPTMYQLILEKAQPSRDELSSLQAMIWSGAASPRSLIEQLRGLCPHLFTSFGLTETAAEVLYTPAGAGDDMLALSVGFPVPQIPLRLGSLDGNGEASEPSGEIQVQGPTVMSGYFNNPQATAAAFTADGWLRTGDIGERREDGSYRITGRIREMYKSGGYNIYPREVELVLERHPGVAIAAVVGVPDPVYGEIGHAWILASDMPVDAAELQAFCRQHLANYKVPKHIHLRTELPMLPIHKVDKVVLRRWSVEAGASSVSPA